MTIQASAPGKWVLLGEYAVLEGAPATALAGTQRASVELAPREADAHRLHSYPGCANGIDWHWDGNDLPCWTDEPPAGIDLRWLQGMLATLRRSGHFPHAPHRLVTDTQPFHRSDGGKLGLGASAALGVALTAAGVTACYGTNAQMPRLAELIALHARAQGGRGSGVDIASAMLGGMVSFRRDDQGMHAARVEPPSGAYFVAVATGRSVSTPAYLAHLQRWRQDHPRQSARILRALGDTAEAGALALARADDLVEAVAAYGRRLATLANATGLEIFGDAHERVGELARAAGVAYKPSGAGGDCGIAVASDGERMARFRNDVAAAGFAALEPAPKACGCVTSINSTSETTAS